MSWLNTRGMCHHVRLVWQVSGAGGGPGAGGGRARKQCGVAGPRRVRRGTHWAGTPCRPRACSDSDARSAMVRGKGAAKRAERPGESPASEPRWRPSRRQQCPRGMDFAALGLDARVARAAAKRFALPTAVQAEAIPLALAGKARRLLVPRRRMWMLGWFRLVADNARVCRPSTAGCNRPSRHRLRQNAGLPAALPAHAPDHGSANQQPRATGPGAGAHTGAVPAGTLLVFLCFTFRRAGATPLV